MKCLLPSGCHNPNRCGDSGECYFASVFEVYEARRKAVELGRIPEDAVLAFGCDVEASGGVRCGEWCHLPGCPVALKEVISQVIPAS